jgi:phage baseplate assembly protein gpV
MFLECFEIIKMGSALSSLPWSGGTKGAGGVVLEKKKNIIVSSNVDVKMQGA